ncbi:BppU family phage baseplate upper protein [Intestinibacter bartlettii]|uniref:BppU family phage baseplate upper protein n=1 Tax=Intestinibacter bartlettii TaxID=261299 RepID=UPI00321BD9F4
MSNITNLNRDYLIKINVKEATIDVPKMTFWNTDKKTSNMFVQLVINMSTNELISNYVTVQNATDYKITLNVIKPKTNQYKTIEATLLNEEKALFEIDLPDEYKDQVGNYNFEFEVSSKVDGNDESITTSNATYEVKGSILTNLNEETSSSPDLPILKQLIEQVKSLQGGDLTGYQKKSDNSLETTSKEVVGAINEVNSQFKDIANYSLTKGTDEKVYIKKQDGTLIGEGIEVGSNVDLSKITMSVSGQTLKLMNGEEQVASVDLPVGTGEIPDNTVLYEEDSESTGDVITAENITIKDTNNNFTAINVEGALSELFQSASNGKELIATAITGKGVETSNTDSFQTMATNINNIKVGGGGITPTGTKEITQNGTYDVTNFASVLVNVVSQGGSSSGNSVESGTITPEEKSTDITIPTSKKCSNMMLFQHVLGTGTGYRTVVGLIRLGDFRTNLTSNSTGATLNVIATSESQINAATVTFRDNGIDVHLNSAAVGGGYLVGKPHVWYAW